MADNTQQNPQTQAQIQQLYAQMQQVQQQYAQLDALMKNPQTDPMQKPAVQQQMQQLTVVYNQILTSLQGLGVNFDQQHVVKPTATKTTSSKFNPRTLALWCGIIFLLVVGGLAWVFWYLMQNPQQLASLGIDAATAKTVLQAFASIFFGLVIFAWFAMLIVNLYRIFTVKNKSKIRYVIWTFFGFVILIWSIALWSSVLTKISNISSEDLVDPNMLLKWYIMLKGGATYLWGDPKLVLIAPTNIAFTLNSNVFNAQVLPTLGANVKVDTVGLDCWNKQVLPLDAASMNFQWMCFYTTKGNFPLLLKIGYTNTQTAEKLSKDVPAGTFGIVSAVKLSLSKGEVAVGNNELLGGKIPAKMNFNASDVFKDFALPEYKIVWDVDGDGTPDGTDQTSLIHIYKQAKVYNVIMRFPGINNYQYTFPLRVEQSDVPVCEIATSQIKGNEYQISTSFLDGNPQISEYVFSIVDRKNGNVIDTFKNTNGSLKYLFPGAGIYAIQVSYITTDGKQGEAESDDIQIGSSDFDVFTSLSIKTPSVPNFKTVILSGDHLTITELPTVLKIDINKIIPNNPGVTKKVFVNDVAVVSTNDSFETTFQESKDYTVKIIVEDINRNMKTEKIFTVGVNRADLLWNLLITPDTVGTSPFTVKFDASATRVFDPADEIVYFSWDFWDGEVKKNISQSIVNHTYNYDLVNEKGEFYPHVTIKTKKWIEIVVGSWTVIVVKKPVNNLIIHINSHPGQRANVGDIVQMSLELNGLPTKIKRDFGNGQNLECADRQCIETSKVYDQPGTYTIKAEAIFDNNLTIEGNINLLVE